jgi:hypothetical protein
MRAAPNPNVTTQIGRLNLDWFTVAVLASSTRITVVCAEISGNSDPGFRGKRVLALINAGVLCPVPDAHDDVINAVPAPYEM